MILGVHNSLQVAEAVLSQLKVLVDRTDSPDMSFYVEAYSNCREQGFCIRSPFLMEDGKLTQLTVVFSENRNSDNIVIYSTNDPDGFNMIGNIPNSEAYANKKYFDYDQTYNAAEFIFKQMKEFEMKFSRTVKVEND